MERRTSKGIPAWSHLNLQQQVDICEKTLREHKANVPPVLPGQSVRARHAQVYDACVENGLEKIAESAAPAPKAEVLLSRETASESPWDRYNAIKDPGERTIFYNDHREEFLRMARS